MKTIMNKTILFITIIIMILSGNITYASMADFTDEQADTITKQNQEEWKKEQVERINKSSNNYLKSLSVKKYDITPEFNKQTINYEIEQEIKDDYIEINAEADDEKSSISGIGKVLLNSGENNIRIDITAENGTVRTYFIKVLKAININNTLSSLKLKNEKDDNIEYTPEFNKEIYEYSCNIENYINKINIEAIADNREAKIEIIGNENLKTGLNEILINVSIENEKTAYKINVYKKEENTIQETKIYDRFSLIISATIVIVIVILFIIIIKKHRMAGKHG